ncbi:MAG: CHRD domain-containing protein [Burkholderiaceae bacterium]|nr:CHRD domain-containing protein [Burkholderiaceae bacterium]
MISYRTALNGTLLVAAVTLSGCAWMNSMMGKDSSNMSMKNQLTGAQEVPAVTTGGTGTVETTFDKSTNVLTWTVTYAGLSGPVTAGHFHGPAMPGANAGVVVPYTGDLASPIRGKATLTAAQAADLTAGRWYANLHTAKNPGGEIRGQVTGK